MTASAVAQAIHRSARLNYPPRAIGFLATFIAIVWLASDRGLGTGALLIAVGCFLVYPHLAFLHARQARDPHRAEQINLLIDNMLLGAWVAAMGFNLWLGYTLFVATVLNSTVIGGPRHLVMSAGAFVLAAATWTIFAGPDFQPHSSLGFALFMAAISAAYVLAIGVIFYRQHKQLARAHKTIGRHNRLFRSLLDLELLSSGASDVAELAEQTLEHFHRGRHDRPFGLVLFNRERPRQLLHTAFRGIGTAQQDLILEKLAALSAQKHQGTTKLDIDSPSPLLAISMGHHLNHANGFVITAKRLADSLGDTLELFVDRLASGLQNKLLNEELRKAAETDDLTGLFNRAYWEAQLTMAIARKRQHSSVDFAVVMVDAIGLKRTNDSLGHESGDKLIRTIADRLVNQARKSDVIARFGGDEFVVLCPNCREAEATGVAERLLDACSSTPVLISHTGGLAEVSVEISVGTAGSDCNEAGQVLSVADARMYADKQAFYQRQGESR